MSTSTIDTRASPTDLLKSSARREGRKLKNWRKRYVRMTEEDNGVVSDCKFVGFRASLLLPQVLASLLSTLSHARGYKYIICCRFRYQLGTPLVMRWSSFRAITLIKGQIGDQYRFFITHMASVPSWRPPPAPACFIPIRPWGLPNLFPPHSP
jgi:hypothetical protein